MLWLRERGSAAALTLIFRADAERHVPDGGTSAAGVIRLGERSLNLNRPGVVRGFLDAAIRCGWLAEARTVGERDGWALFDAVHA